MTGLLIVGILVALAMLAPRYGTDSRDGRDWSGKRDRLRPFLARHTVHADLRAVAGLALAAWQRQERAWGATWSAHQPWRSGPESHRPGELRWREVDGSWQLHGAIAPQNPPVDKPRAHTD